MKRFVLIVMLLGVLALTAVVLAQSTNFAIPWWTADGGGGQASGGQYALSGTIGRIGSFLGEDGGGWRS